MNCIVKLIVVMVDWFLFVMGSLVMWFIGSLVMDLLVVFSLFVVGMMVELGFISVGYLLFFVFNYLELLFVGLVLFGCFLFY